jgi:uncharacterized OB-fold protein
VLEIHVCTVCGQAVFPPRLACPRCHGVAWRTDHADAGTIEHVTAVRRSPVVPEGGAPIRLALVKTDLGPRVIARLDVDAAPGTRVELASHDGAVSARPVRSG